MSNARTPVVFTGKAGEYFGIWIVNLLLSIVTLGIYSAWAKVRRKKYFYNNTLVDGVGFDYHANPVTILKGRVIALVLFVLYQVLARFSPMVAIVLLIAFFIALPWIVVRGMTFNARNSSHRGLRFDFDGKYGQAALAFIGYPLLILVTLGLALPFVAQRFNKFAFSHHKFGLSRFQMHALVKNFYMVYLKLFGVIFAIGLILSLAVNSWVGSHKPAQTSFNQHQYLQQTATNTQAAGFIKIANTETTPDTASEKLSQEEFIKSLTPEDHAEFEARMKVYEVQTQQSEDLQEPEAHTQNPIEKLFGPYAAMLGPLVYALIFGIIAIYVAVTLAMTAYIHSRVSNLIWNNTSLEHIGFASNQRMRDLVWLYFSNALLVLLAIGLATPWAQIRMARYRAEHLVLTGETNWDKFVGEKKEASRAMGEEIAEMFDVDLSFG